MADPRAILITGGAYGIGAAMVHRFTAAGHQVAVARAINVSIRSTTSAGIREAIRNVRVFSA